MTDELYSEYTVIADRTSPEVPVNGKPAPENTQLSFFEKLVTLIKSLLSIMIMNLIPKF